MENILCIDFGTKYIKSCVYHDGKIIPLIDENEEDSFLASIFIDGNKVIFGKEALKISSSNYKNYFDAIKINLGNDFKRDINGYYISSKEILALIFKRLKYMAEYIINGSISKAYVSIPNLFTSKERKMVIDAGKLINLNIEKLFNESVLGPIYYLKDKKAYDKHFLSIDFGGGYLDISVSEVFDGGIETYSCCKNGRIGGIDLDQILVDLMKEKVLHDYEDLKLDDDQILRIYNEAQSVKIYLSNHNFATFYLPFIKDLEGNDKHLTYSITLEEFKNACKNILTSIKEEINYALISSGLSIDEIDYIFINGGSFNLPFIKEEISLLFSQDKIVYLKKEDTLNGLGYIAQRKDYLIIDILTSSIKSFNEKLMGVERISQNSGIPTTCKMAVTKSFVELRQGNDAYFENNTLLFKIDKKDLTKEKVALLTLYVDNNGILSLYHPNENNEIVQYVIEDNITSSYIDNLKIEIE